METYFQQISSSTYIYLIDRYMGLGSAAHKAHISSNESLRNLIHR